MRAKLGGLLALLMVVSSCQREEAFGPKGRLKSYISRSFSVNSVKDRGDLEAYLIGDSKRRLQAWSAEQFEKVFLMNKRKFLNLKFKETKNVSAKEINITYELSYLDYGKGKAKRGAKITNKKLCTMVEKDGKWFIKEVKNLKELIEYQDELTLP